MPTLPTPGVYEPITLEEVRSPPAPLERRVGRAEEAWMRARVERARAAGDGPGEHVACATLARWLAERDRDCGEVVALAEAALRLADDADLRRDLASWLEGLGEFARAAAALGPVAASPGVAYTEAAYVLVRTGVLQARAAEARKAREAFEEAMRVDADEALAGEMLGSLAAWAPDAVPASTAADAYVEAARRRAVAGQPEAELEDLWRAFATAPSSATAVEALAHALEARGREAAADELRRAHAATFASPQLAAGDLERARRDAEAATHAAPGEPRGVATLADVVLASGERSRPAAATLERAVVVAGPRFEWCVALADRLEALGEPALAVGWSQRCVALRPGDRAAIDKLVDRTVRAADAARLANTLTWWLSQPQPASQVAGPFASALVELAGLDADRALAVARKALDRLGPESRELRAAMLQAATRASADALRVAILERSASCGGAAERPAVFASLADAYGRSGDHEGRARVLARAARDGPWTSDLDRHAQNLDDPCGSADATIWRIRTRIARASSGDEAARLWRDLGGALWDLADDRAGAMAAWERAARSTPRRGFETLAADLIRFAGAGDAFEILSRRIDAEPDDTIAAAIATGAASAVLASGDAAAAFDFASRALSRRASSTEALSIAERAAHRSRGRAADLSALYRLVATRALGRFGRRAAHYRGARFFERASEPALALVHAAHAFEAVPAEGYSFQLLARAAERAGDRAQAVGAVERVAERVGGSARAAWLLRAASITGEGEESSRQKVDILLRAAAAAPAMATIALLLDAARAHLRLCPDERGVVEIRLGLASRTIADRADGPEGARMSIAFAEMWLDLFSDAEGAFSWVERAFGCDADIDEFRDLAPHARELGAARGARDAVAKTIAAAEKSFANVGIEALRLCAAMAAASGDEKLRGRAVVAAATKESDDDALVVAADACARAASDLDEPLAKRISYERRAEALLATARAHASKGSHAAAAALFERALELTDANGVSPLPLEHRMVVEGELQTSWGAAKLASQAESRAPHSDAASDASPGSRAERWAEVAARREQRGDLEGAQAAWQRVLSLEADHEDADRALERIAAARGRYDELVDHLAARAERLHAQPDRREILRAVRLHRAAILDQRLGRAKDASDELARLLEESPDDGAALRYLAELFERRGEPARAAPLWERAAALEGDAEERAELSRRASRASMIAPAPSSSVAPAAQTPAEALRACRKRVSDEPGDLSALERLRDAAVADDDRILASAIEHVLRAFDPHGSALDPPPLAGQPAQPHLLSVLARPSLDALGEALAMLWEGASQMFVRDLSAYGITGVERVEPGPASPIARLYEASMRLLDCPRIPLFVARSSGAVPTSRGALLSPASAIVTGEVRDDTPALRFALGRGMSAALPHNVLRLGLDAAQGSAMFEAMWAAFGPPRTTGRRLEPRVARLAESYWQLIPAGRQRRLQELLSDAIVPEYERLVARAQQCGRRIGMFLAGDFALAARAVLAESNVSEEPTPATLRPLCAKVPALADLLLLAVSGEYADARWHLVASGRAR